MQGEILTVHSYELPRISPRHLPNTLSDIYNSIQLEEFENFKNEIPTLRNIARAHQLGHVKVTNVLEEGKPLSTIIRVARKENADLIIMGTKGATGLREIFLGSVTGEVMEKAPCPVLGIPLNAEFDGVLNVFAVTTDFSQEDAVALKQVSQFAGIFGAEVRCIHFDVLHQEKLIHQLSQWKEELDFDISHIHFEVIDTSHLENSMVEYIDKHEVDIVAMLIHKRGFFEEMFNYSLAKKMAYHLYTPILALPAAVLVSVN